MKEVLNYLFTGNSLTKEQACEILTHIAEGKFTDEEIAAFLTVYRMRTVNAEELCGFREALLDLCVKVDFPEFNTIDVVGTGGDGKNTFNISTASCFLIAGAGYKVTKHGNYGSSSVSGASNMFEYFGYQFSNDVDKLRREVDRIGLCFFHAPLFHPAMKNVGPVRRALKVRTLFNIMGPIINPCSPKNQLVGVSDIPTMDLYNQVFKEGDQSYMLVHTLDGYDEVSLTAETRYIDNSIEDSLSPADFGFSIIRPDELSAGNSVEDAARIFKNVMNADATEAQMNVVIANAALGIKCMHPGKTLSDCVAEANESLKSKKAREVFTKLMNAE
jgi:anthranilate phosphoribosyltransferase